MEYVEQMSVVSVLAVMGLAIAPTGSGGLRCPFSVASIHLSSSKSLRRMDRTPALQGKRPFETLTCAKRGRRGICTGGGLKAGTRVIGAFRVAGDPCEEPRMSVRIVVSGGVDGPPGAPVPAIGLSDEKSVSRPRGCG